MVAGEFRQLEYQNALRFVSTVKKPQTQREHELWSVAHDVMTPNHDRQFRELSAFLPTCLLRNEEVLRIYDIEECDGKIRANAHVYGKEHHSSIEQDLTLCVWNGHMRCLFPTSITAADNWKTWASYVDTVFSYEWEEWSVHLEQDESAVTVYTLEPCGVFQQLTRIPRPNVFSPTGHEEPEYSATTSDWRNEWNPWVFSSMAQPTNTPLLQQTNDAKGIGPLSPDQQRRLGWDYMPDCTHEWRQCGPLAECSSRYFEGVQTGFSLDGLQGLALRGDSLIRELGGLYPALCALQEDKFRLMNDQVDFASSHRDLFPKQYDLMAKTLTHGASAFILAEYL